MKKHKNACFQKAKKKLLRIHKNFPHAHTKEHEHEQLPHKMVQLPSDENNNKSLPITVSLSESEDKARARDLTLLECQQLALEYNFVKENAPSHGTVQQRADVVGFFKQYGANGLSQFKKKFGSMKLYPPGEKEVEFYSSSGSCEDDDLMGSNGDSFLKKPISKEDIEEAIPIY